MGIRSGLKPFELTPMVNLTYAKVKPGEEILITGMSGRFPDSSDIYHFRDNLFNKVDLISADDRRWKSAHPEVPQRTGKLFDIDRFDAGFFAVPQNHIRNMDPMLRMNLELVYEALLDAGHHPFDLAGTDTGVYAGVCYSETEKFAFYSDVQTGCSLTGTKRSMMAKRVAHYFGFDGPAFITDTACSSSMFAVEHAYRHLREGRCRRAVVCGTQLCLNPTVALQFARLGVLSPDGSCKSFDDASNGYARSEAAVVIVLEKAKDARRVYAEVVHSKTNCDGYKEQGITFPSSRMQKVLMNEFYEECGVDPTTLTFVEAHGTGTKVGDPEELDTLDEVFLKGRERPLHIGAIKSNIGHSEAASGLCSVVKVLIGFESGFIPPNINYSTPRKGVEPLEKGRMVVVTEKIPWPDQNGLVGINSFGFGGANGHVLLRWNRNIKVDSGIPKDNLPRLVCASGRTESTIAAIFDSASEMDAEFIKLVHQIFRKTIPNQLFNGYAIISKRGEVERITERSSTIGNKMRIVFGNANSKWYSLAGKLTDVLAFSSAVQRILDILDEDLKINLSGIIRGESKEPVIDTKLATVVVQLALADLIKGLNLDIDEIIGIGYGELAAAYFDGYLSLREALLATYYFSNGNTEKLKNVFAKKVLKASNWSPVYNVDKHSYLYPQGSLEYFLQNVSKPITLTRQNRGQIRKDCTINLIVGPRNEADLPQKHILLVGNDGCDPVVDLLRSLGRLFLAGFPSHLDFLYVPVAYPVSRGTPMVSPLIKWNHSDSHNVYLYSNKEKCKNGQRMITIDIHPEDWAFIAGHVVDGRNLFPATGYLILAWDSYTLLFGRLMCDMGIVFEDVKFIRACNIPPDGILTFKVTIQLENRSFEIVEGDAVLVTGRLYQLNDDHKFGEERFEGNGEFEMDESDVYKELRLRGYHYTDQFRAIKKCSLDGRRALIFWNSNWITFMDNMLQVQLLSEDSRNLYVPTSIKRVVMNGPEQIKQAAINNSLVPVTYCKDTGIISGGGIEIVGLGATVIPRRKPAEPVLESYKFVPYHGKLEECHAVRCMVQTILENANTVKVKCVEILGDVWEEPLMPLVQQTLGDVPLIQADLKVLSSNENLDCGPGISIENKAPSTESACLIVIVTDVLEDPVLLLTALRIARDASGFIISKQTKNIPEGIVSQIQILSSYETQNGNLLLIKESSQYIERIPVNIPPFFEDDLAWLERLQSLASKNVVVYTQDAPVNGTLGLVNCLRREFTRNNILTIVIADEAPPFNIDNPFFKSQLKKNLAFSIFKHGKWGSYRHLPLPDIQTVEKRPCYVNVAIRGDLSSLRWFEGTSSDETTAYFEKTFIDIHYSAINFRDVMTASGRLSADTITRDRVRQECLQGIEFSGRMSSDPTKRVMGMVESGALSTMINADPKLLWALPDGWSLEDAATVPVVYGTVLCAFLMRSRMRPGQSVLVHSATGGVGQAAINVALHMGCTVFATVGTREKREFLSKHFPQIKPEHIGDSRSTSFEQMVLERTGGRGVDYVLNSLAEEKLQASVRCLAYNGTFLEIGKFDLASDSQLATALLRKQARYEGIMLDRLFAACDETKVALSKLMAEGVSNGSIKPLVRTVFANDKIEEAFRYMSTGKHIGKVLVKVREENQDGHLKLLKGIPRLTCNDLACHVILGGLGGFGLELADWLVTRGAKRLVLVSRTGIKNGYQSYRLNIFKSYGVKVSVRSDDVGTEKGCLDLLSFAASLGPVEGIFNLAVVLKDTLFENQTVETFKTALTPKAYATWHLDIVSRKLCPDLRYFVVFSSVVCGRGNVGQTNYGMANSVMERVCEQRKRDGYPALAIQWGAIGEVGLVADMQENHQEMVIGGTLQQRLSNCLHVLDRLLWQEEPIVSSIVVAEKKAGSGAANIFDAVLNIIGVTNLKTVSLHATFPELGMDSMMAVEIKQTLEREYEVFLTAQDIRSMTLAKLKDITVEQVEAITKPAQNELGTDLPEDLKLLFRHIGDEESSHEPVVRLKSPKNPADDCSPPVFVFAGIEGRADVYEPVAKQLDAKLVCLQFCAGNHSDSIEELAEPLVEVISSTVDDSFTIVAYSFGCVVATEIMHSLESLGKVGRAFFIDGSPELITRLAWKYFPFYDDEMLETGLLCVLMTRYMPFNAIAKLRADIVRQKTYKDKIRYVLGMLPPAAVNHSEGYIVDMCMAALNRLKAVRKYEPRGRKLNSRITLAKPTRQSLVEIAEDYNLSAVTREPVEVKVIEGDHVSILESKRLAEEIQLFLDADR